MDFPGIGVFVVAVSGLTRERDRHAVERCVAAQRVQAIVGRDVVEALPGMFSRD